MLKGIFKSYLFPGEGCASFLLHIEIGGGWHSKNFLSHIYLEFKDACSINYTENSEEDDSERYIFSRIYTEVNDLHTIYSSLKSVEADTERYF